MAVSQRTVRVGQTKASCLELLYSGQSLTIPSGTNFGHMKDHS